MLHLLALQIGSLRASFAAYRRLPIVLSFVLGLLCVCGLSGRADITIKFDDLKDGDKISDIAVIVVRADSNDGVDKVEFSVDDQLRFSSGSTPYTFKWDTIADTEGAHNLAVTAIDSTGAKKTVTLALTIDNQLSLGAPALAQKARDALAAGDMETAAKYSRRALKAQPDNIEASRALAAILADKLEWDKAVSTLEKAKGLSDSAPAMLELASYHMRHGTLPENAANLVTDFETAGELRRKAAVLDLEKAGAKSAQVDQEQGRQILGDAYVNAGRYTDAIQEYSKSSGTGSLAATNRLALAFILDNQSQQAVALLRPILKDKGGDAASRAVMGLAFLRLHQFADAKEVVRSNVGAANPAGSIVASYADSALGKLDTAVQEAKTAVDARPAAGEAHYALSMAYARPIDSEPEIARALALSPFQPGPMVDYAVRYSLLKEHTDRFETAIKLLDLVLKSNPDNRGARISKVLLLLHTNKIKDAEPILSELARKDPQAADVQVVAAIYFRIKDNPAASEERLKQARNLDKEFSEISTAPSPLEFLYTLVRKVHYRADFFLSPATLYPPKTGTATTL